MDNEKKPYQTPKLTAGATADLAVTMITSLCLDRDRLQLENRNLRAALMDLLVLWDRREGSGWTAYDVQRMALIRELVKANGGNHEKSAQQAAPAAPDPAGSGAPRRLPLS